MKKMFMLVLLTGLVGGAAWFGWNRDAARGPASPEAAEKLLLIDRFIAQRDAPKALSLLDELTTAGYRLGEQGDLARLRALDLAGRHSESATAAQAFLKSYPESPHRSTAEFVRLAGELSAAGLSKPGLRESITTFLNDNPNHPESVSLQMALAREEIKLGDFAAAERRVLPHLQEADRQPAVMQVAKHLGAANLNALISSSAGPGDTLYKVRSGDTINVIARQHGVTEELVMMANNITNPRMLRVGQELRIPKVGFTLHVDVGSNLMELRNNGRFFKLYVVRTGREAGTTPTGQFKVLNKKRGPTWRPGNGDVYGPGDPNNELGTRWMAFEGDILGIHGTIHPATVGEYASNGCVGMLTEEVEELFDLITVGTPLEIRGERDLNRHRVIPAAPLQRPREIAQN